jgi:small subunit ribosomal protein S21
MGLYCSFSPQWRVAGTVVCPRRGTSRNKNGSRETHVIKVKPRGNESIQQMLKRFKRLCQREGLVRDIKRHSYYEKPSERKRRQSRKAARRVDKGLPPRR